MSIDSIESERGGLRYVLYLAETKGQGSFREKALRNRDEYWRRFKTRIRLVYNFTGHNMVLVRDSGFGIRDSGLYGLLVFYFKST